MIPPSCPIIYHCIYSEKGWKWTAVSLWLNRYVHTSSTETGPSVMGSPFLCHYKLKGFKSCEESQTLCEMRSQCRMGSGGPGALLWGLSLGRWVTTQARFCCSLAGVQIRHTGCSGWMKGSLLHGTPGWRGAARVGLRALTRDIPVGTQLECAEGGRTAAQGQLLAAATPCTGTGENPGLEGCRDNVQTLFPLNQKCLDKPA